ncbi:MAG: sialate O-acetylesterase [Saprospiraceae bacterium]|nr:sialate O-acetylesterase [Saprospiraceae bacterium]
MKLLTITSLLLFTLFVNAQPLETSAIFTDHMILQRDVQVPVWGWAAANEKINITFNNKTYTDKADKQGKWRILLPIMPAGGPYDIKIAGKNKIIDIKDIMFGDVWLASGQSNMEWPVAAANNAQKEIAAANDHKIRHFYVPHEGSEMPQDKINGGPWQMASPQTVGNFTAVGYYFAKELRKHHDIPIGLLHSSWGGSRLEPWMSPESLGITDISKVAEQLKQQREERTKAIRNKLQQTIGALPEKDMGLQNGQALWAANDYYDGDWKIMKLPTLWENAELPDLDGIIWFRKTIELSAADIQKDATLSLGPIDDSDMTWVNGQKIGEMIQRYNENRIYNIPASILKAGKNIITVRVDDTGGGGGIYGKPELLYLETANKKHDIIGEWKYKVGEARFGGGNSTTNQTPMLLYNKMIHPILDFPIKGVIWYQGESNAGGNDAYEYRNLFHTMIQDWRARWTNSGTFPFLFVQLANFMQAKSDPSESDWAVLRESQSKTLTTTTNTGQAVIIDIGEADDIHPRNKQDVGYRLSLAARKLAYGDDKIIYSGPVYKSMKIESNKIRLSFDHVGGGLMAKDKYGYLKGFAIAGADKKFVWSQAIIDGDHVIVWNDNIKNPVAVRYAWADNPEDANFYNKEGLPASPFRTDGQ